MSSTGNISPPRWADRFLQFYCREEFLEEIQGDVHELFEARRQESLFRAKRLFIWDVIRFFKWSNIKLSSKQQFSQLTMVKNNIKIARRTLWRNKFYTGINLVGISLGIACFLLSSLYAYHEYSYDRFHSKLDDIYRVWIHELDEGDEYFEGVVPMVMNGPLKTGFPEIAHTVQIKDIIGNYTSKEQLLLRKRMSVVDPDFLEVFDFEMIAGDRATALSKRESIVLTESDAMERFGTLDVVGKTADYKFRDEKYEFIITGVIKDTPSNSSISYHSLISSANNERLISANNLTGWWVFSTEIYVQLKEGMSVKALEAKFPKMVETGMGEDYEEGIFNVYLQPLTAVHFDTVVDGENEPGDLQTVQILALVGFLILILAGINFVNLSIGQSMRRAREVGVRKVMGAFRMQLINQFLGESLLLTLIAAILGLFTSWLLLPVFNNFAGTELLLQLNTPLLTALGIAVLVIGLLSGIYPALVLSSFKPVVVLKSLKANHKTRNGLAYSLIVLQFLTAIFFVSATIIMNHQVTYLANKDLGFDQEAKVYVRLPRAKGDFQGMSPIMNANQALANQLVPDLNRIAGINQLAIANNYFGDEGWILFEYKDEEKKVHEFYYNHIDERFIDFFDIDMVAGKSFATATELEKKTGVIVNQAFVKEYKLEDPIGKRIGNTDFGDNKIIGVINDFHFASLHKKVEPLVMSMDAAPLFKGIYGISINQNTCATILAEVNLDNIAEVRDEFKTVWESRFNEPFELNFLDAQLEKLYEKERRTSAMVLLITVLAVVIASLGLLGLAALTIKNRFKEIGIRKVLGASTGSIFQLLYKLFLSPVMIAFIISIPLTVWVMNQWLQNFAYQVSLNPFHFLVSAAAIILITLLAVSYQSVRVARANPVDTIRYE